MADRRVKSRRVQELVDENARLRGENLATGVILAQLLQATARMQLNPTAYATRIINQAHEAIESFNIDLAKDANFKEIVKASALETVRHYDTQLRTALPI
jgi:hypothetical protein